MSIYTAYVTYRGGLLEIIRGVVADNEIIGKRKAIATLKRMRKYSANELVSQFLRHLYGHGEKPKGLDVKLVQETELS